MVIATQNPIELEGTYPLPEAQLDRFLMRIPMGYPDRDAELAILEAQGDASAHRRRRSQPVASAADVADAAALVGARARRPELRGYIVDLVDASRRHPDLVLGASPRGSLALQRAARALAASFGRDFVIPDDVKRVAARGARAPAAARARRPAARRLRAATSSLRSWRRCRCRARPAR